MKKMWKGKFPKNARALFNTRVVGQVVNNKKVVLPTRLRGEFSYASPTNRDRNGIHSLNWKIHVVHTCPPFDSPEMPPEHTIVIEADIQSTSKNKRKIDNVIKQRILTSCGDDNMKYSHKYVNPALCLYV